MNERKFPPPPPKPHINKEQPSQETAQPEVTEEAPQPEKQKRQVNLRLLFLVIGAIISFIGATVCGYFLFG